jgi:maltose-binding protein MalE
MKKNLIILASALLIVSLLAGCAATPTAAPTQPPAPTKAPAAPTNTPVPPTKAPAKEVTIKLWHSWTGAEAETGQKAIDSFTAANPNIKLEILAVPFDQLKNKYTTEASTGGGPDLLIGPKDWIGELAQANLIAPLDGLSGQIGLDKLSKTAVEANKFQGKVWAFPESTEAVALYYNTDKVKTPPKDTDELLKLAAEVGLGLNIGFYHSSGILFGAGAKLFDDKQVCVLDQGNGIVDALTFMKAAKATANVLADGDGGKLDAAFKDGKVGMIFNGPWASGDYAKALGADKIAIADPIVIKSSGKTFAPFLGTKNIFLSANSKGDAQAAAVKLLASLTDPGIQAEFVKVGHIPSNPATKTDSKIVAGFIKQTQSASYFPNEPEMGAVWTPAGDMIVKALEGKAEPLAAAQEAAKAINAANKK